MSYLPFAILSQLLNSIAVTVDKFLLTKLIPDPIIYIFYFSLVSLVTLVAIPFVPTPTILVFILASTSTLFWTLGAYLMFKALKIGQVQRVIPIIGTITPLVLLILSAQTDSITAVQVLAVIILILGLVFLTLNDLKGKLIKEELLLEFSAACLFAFNYYLLRLAFLKMGFLTVLVYTRPILIPLGIILIAIPGIRAKIWLFLKPQTGQIRKGAPLFIFGQVASAASEFLLFFSISLANPALVNSLQGIKYIFLLIFSLILGRKFPEIFQNKFQGYYALSQTLGIAAIGFGLYLLAATP